VFIFSSTCFVLFVDRFPFLFIYIYIQGVFFFNNTTISVKVKMPVENETVQRRLIFEDNLSNTDGNSFGTF
jgi:hypothetical protein